MKNKEIATIIFTTYPSKTDNKIRVPLVPGCIIGCGNFCESKEFNRHARLIVENRTACFTQLTEVNQFNYDSSETRELPAASFCATTGL